MKPVEPCPRCGSARSEETVAGQCPACLLETALGAEEDPGDLMFGSGPRQFGDYVLERQVGAGGMGVVYEAWNRVDGRKVALKLIRDSHVASPAHLRRFMIEAEAAARLNHPNIARIHDIGECNGLPFYSMDFIAGECLTPGPVGNRSRSEGPQARLAEADEVAHLMALIARAVHHAHLQGVLHRDLKPGNILIDNEGGPHLTDFGLAKLLEARPADDSAPALTTTGDAPGTPSYMSPEQVSGGDIGPATDVYGLGAILYALLTGWPPFRAATPLEIFRLIAGHPPAGPRALNFQVPRDLEIICLKCLEKDPRHRYATAETLAEDLEAFAAGRAILARPTRPLRRAGQWIRRNPLGAAFIASLCLGLSVALALLKVVDDQRREMQLDRNLAFEEGMRKISEIWSDPETKSVTITARELAILAGRSPADGADAMHELTFGVSADDGPSSMAQRFARLLGGFQESMTGRLGERVAFQLRLLKRFNPNDLTLARGGADFMVLSAVDFLRAQQMTPGVTFVAAAGRSREAVLFARADSGIQHLEQLGGRSIGFPDPDQSLTVMAQARLTAAGIRGHDLRFWTNILDRGPESGETVVSCAETVAQVLRGELDAGVTRRGRFERYRHLGLLDLDRFPEAPLLFAARSGLDSKLVGAFLEAVESTNPAPVWAAGDPSAVSVPTRPLPTDAMLESLRSAVADAVRFQAPPEK